MLKLQSCNPNDMPQDEQGAGGKVTLRDERILIYEIEL